MEGLRVALIAMVYTVIIFITLLCIFINLIFGTKDVCFHVSTTLSVWLLLTQPHVSTFRHQIHPRATVEMGVGNLLGHLSWLDPLLDFQNRAWGLSNGNCVSEIVNAWSLPRYVLNLLCRALTQTTSIAAPTYPLCAHVSSAVVIAAIRDGSAVHSVCCRGDCFRIFLWRHCGPGKESRDCRIWSCVWCPPSVRSVSTMNHHLHCTYVSEKGSLLVCSKRLQ